MDVYRSPNIGVFMKANDRFHILPDGMAASKVLKLSSLLDVKPVRASVAGSRLLGPLMSLNSKGILVSRFAEDGEIASLSRATGLKVERLPSKHTSVGNLIAANDYGAIVSKILSLHIRRIVEEVLDVSTQAMNIASYYQVGSMISASNIGAIVHPKASEEEIRMIEDVLKVEVHPATVNSGVPFVSSGVVVNSRNAVVGSLTSGVELIILSRAFKI